MSKQPCCAKPIKGPKGDPGDPPIWGNITGDVADQTDLYDVFATTDDLNTGLAQAQGNLVDAIAQEVLDRDAAIADAISGGGGGSTAFADITGDPEDNNALSDALALKVNVADLGTAAYADTGDFDTAGAASTAQAYAIQRANHTGTQLAATVSDFGTAAIAAAPAETTTTVGALINGATAKTTPVDADFIGLMDSAASNILKKLSWANIKATLKTYFDTLYATESNVDNLKQDTIDGFIEVAANKTYTLQEYSFAGYTINELRIICSSGTCTVAVQIDGTNVTGLSAVSVTSSGTTATATAANSVTATHKVTLVVSSVSSAVNVSFSLGYTRSI